jgi:hypothetical protein
MVRGPDKWAIRAWRSATGGARFTSITRWEELGVHYRATIPPETADHVVVAPRPR